MTSNSRLPRASEVAPALMPTRSFEDACTQVIAFLTATTPMGMWAVTRVAHGRQLMLAIDSPGYGIPAGTDFPFDTSMCRPMSAGIAPQIAPDVGAVPEFVAEQAAAAAQGVEVGAYVGTPIVRPDGELFGTLCGYDPEPQPDSLYGLQPLITLLSNLLSSVLESDTAATGAARALEQARAEADSDSLTGLLNRRGWDRFVRVEEDRFRRFGDPACVIMLDLDQLKAVNDTSGHHVGDRYIQRAADVLRETCRSADVLARLGGDEFGVIAVGASTEQAAQLVDRIDQALTGAGIAGSVGHAPYSIVAGFPGALEAADQAMYERKQERRAARLARLV